MRETTEMCLRTTRSSIVRPATISSARRPSSAIPRFTEIKMTPDDETRPENSIDDSMSSAQTMNVYLRLKPRSTKSKRLKKIEENTYVVADSTSLRTKFPCLESSSSCGKKGKSPETPSRRFTFTRILGPESTQSEFFEVTTKQRVLDFLAGQSFTLMTYGTTNSGKTYTLYGTRDSPGIVPRSIEFVFSSISCTLVPWYKPANFCDVVALDDATRCQEIEARDHFLTSRPTDKSALEESYGSLNSKNEDWSKSGEAMYSVWLSFIEIYNDNIYDLLACEESRSKLAPLRLVVDKQNRPFVQGSRWICATTGLEAYKIFTIGRSRLTVGSSGPNSSCSRSHSVFTMTLLKYVKECSPEEVSLTTMTFCDLAGTGRSRMPSSMGNELKEAKNINTSLLVLGRCLKVVSDSQTGRQNSEVIGPFRESKLTRLFQRGISGKENLCFIVNIDTTPDFYVETQAVLYFASMVGRIVLEIEKDVKSSCAYDPVIPSPRASSRDWEKPSSHELVETFEKQENKSRVDVEQLSELNVTLSKEIAILRETALNREYEIRQEMAKLCSNIIKDVDAKWRKRTKDVEEEKDDFLKWSIKQVEIFYKERIDSLTNRKRRRTSSGDHLDNGKGLYQELEAENSRITTKVIVLREAVKKLQEEHENLSAEKNKCVFELSLSRNILKQIRQIIDDERGEKMFIDENENDVARIIDDLNLLINEKNETISNLKKNLDDVKNRRSTNSESLLGEKAEIRDHDPVLFLKSLPLEQLEDEIARRNREVSDSKGSNILEIFNEAVVEETEVDVKFSTSTFKKESNHIFLPSSTRYSIVEAENFVTENETSCARSSTSRCSSFPNDETTRDLHISFLETIDDVFRSSVNVNSKDDSGIGVSNVMSSSTENSLGHITEERSSQTIFESPEKPANELIQGKIEQLKMDYTKLKSDHLQETVRVGELSQELESIQSSLEELKVTSRLYESKIRDYQEKLSSRDRDLSDSERKNLDQEKELCNLTKKLESCMTKYEDRINRLQNEISVREINENRLMNSLSESQERATILESQLTVAHVQIDKNSIRCITEHVPKIQRLESELSEKSSRVSELSEKISRLESDANRVQELSERVTSFGKIAEGCMGEREELRRQLLERSETQSSLECKIKRLASKIHERENEIASLRMDLDNVIKMNMENNERVRELSKEISRANGRLASVRDEIARSEEEQRKLEKNSEHEIGNLIARLAAFEKNATILTRMRDNETSRIDELDSLKMVLRRKEREMSTFKKNRDKTIRRYESLIKKLQADVETRCNRESSKLRMLYPKRSISKESLRSVTESLRWKTTLRRSVERVRSSQAIVEMRKSRRFQSSDHCDHGCSREYPTCSSVVKRSSSRALVASSTSLEGSQSSGSKNFSIRYEDDEESVGAEIIETESQTELNVNIVKCRSCGCRDGLSQTAPTFSMPTTSDDSFTNFDESPEWMGIRRTSGKTHFRLRNGDSRITSESKIRL